MNTLQHKHIRLYSRRSVARAGFTLLEVMVAMAILAIALTAIISSQSRTLFFADANDFAQVSAYLAAGKMADLMQQDLDAPAAGAFNKSFAGYSWRAEIVEESMTEIDSVQVPSGLVKITLQVSDDRRGQVFVVSRYRFGAGNR